MLWSLFLFIAEKYNITAPGPKVDINNVWECPRPLLPTAIYEKEKNAERDYTLG